MENPLHIKYEDTLRQGTDKLNKAIDYAADSRTIAEESRAIAEEGKNNADAAALEARKAAGEAEIAADHADAATSELENLKKDVGKAIENADSFSYEQEYDPERTYNKNNQVSYDGSTYIALVDRIKGVLPSDSSRWGLVARRGVDGMGAVSSINGKGPNENGNITIIPAEIGAASEQQLTNVTQQLEVNMVLVKGSGDGIADDTASIQNAIDSLEDGGILKFEPNKRYRITSTLQIDIGKILGIIGNNASIILDDDIVAFNIFGGLTTGSASPTDPNTQSVKYSINTFIENLRISSTINPSVGVGFKLSDTFGVRIKDCHLYELRKGIEVINRNRNLFITGNHIWNCSEYCVHYHEANVHQSIINNNHMSYAKTIIFFENGDVHNIQIVGNDLEGGYSQNNNHDNVIKAICEKVNTQISQLQIVGNSIEEHFCSLDGLVNLSRTFIHPRDLLEGEKAPYIGIWEIVGNEFSGSDVGIYLRSGFEGVISGNTFKNLRDYGIKCYEVVQSVTITSNTFSGNSNNLHLGGAFIMHGGSKNTTGELSNFIFADNVCTYLSKNAIVITKMNEQVELFEVFETIFSNNTLNTSVYSNEYPFVGFMFDIDVTTIHSLLISGNFCRPRAGNEHGMRVRAASANNMIVKDNCIRGLVARGGVNPIYYSFPTSATSIIKDNLPIQ